MTRLRRLRFVRRGFTLVELMVATALVVLILTILAVAFGAATDSLSRMRSMGNMATDLRGTQDKLRADLEAQHFETGDSPGTLRLSDLRYHELGTVAGVNVRTPLGGFFRIESGSGSIYEGADADGLSSTRGTSHVLDFTAKRQGTSPDDLYVVPATSPAVVNQNATDTPLNTVNQFASKWARVRWYLDNQQPNPAIPGQPVTFTLYRCVRVVTPSNATLNALEQEQVAHTGGTSRTLTELTNPVNRPVIGRYQPGTPYYGDDIVLSNVTSFEVKPVWEGPTPPNGPPRSPRTLWPATAIGGNIPDSGIIGAGLPNGDLSFDDLPASAVLPGQRVFDTWYDVNTVPLRIRVTALQVKIRVIDPKTLLSRQVSFIVQP